jgi:hypothetical protein
VQVKTRVAGVLVVTAAAVAMVGQRPVNICGAAVSILGFSNAGCRGGAGVVSDSGNTSNNFDFGGF